MGFKGSDVALSVDFRMAIELEAAEKGYTLEQSFIERLNDKINGTLNELVDLEQLITESVSLGTETVEADLSNDNLVPGQMYVIKDAPRIKKQYRNNAVEFLGLDGNDHPLVRTSKGETLSLVFGAGCLKCMA